ncbi:MULTISPECIES: helix-turn-helix transcriptional regulator [Shewanella]|jgi:DNA-binding NarL/FixJ family response regulator|uniref:DNA-binding response regulator n=1 Tax=Shewanella psychromarinicola TaxID=2487742 RepID=A0A3N4E893_9GAMM|nr:MULTISPECIES: LuxR C-terminal-related transcriptional regulator [Shewanella]AZG35044.1 DNA-binding response regulator [Shewanella psychromarinicola]MCL1082765.1 LuxR C-terminal-related transcriptional regulator [Shewanella psychromarinicola]PKG80088.1 LuxR family transcriptional regulator [Shewanella sp. Actino-trap-3]RPA33157.1 DNA-binding response regulator [Shewanella psychromarinicola]
MKKDVAIIVLLLLITLFKLFDIIADLQLEIPAWHIAQESILVLLTIVGSIYLGYDLIRSSRQVKALGFKLANADKQINNMSSKMRAARQEYSQTIAIQFDTWGFTKSEQQVALLLLKGLSFKEIAEVRLTKEKTVRQQASTIYSKAEVDGRHTFSAWFMEDFIQD